MSSTISLPPELRWAIAAAQDKKAADLTLLDLAGLGAFTEAFLLCTGFSSPQLQAISDAIEEALKQHGLRPAHREAPADHRYDQRRTRRRAIGTSRWLFALTAIPIRRGRWPL